MVEIAFDADFVDVFQVRGCVRQRHGHYFQPLVGKDFLIFPYRGLDEIERHTQIRFSPPPNEIRDRVARWRVRETRVWQGGSRCPRPRWARTPPPS